MSKYKVPTIKEMVEAGVHFGHRTRRWHPNMEKYIYTVKNNIHIIDLEITEQKLKEACEFLYEVGANGGKVVFVGTKKQAAETIESAAKDSGAMYITDRWIGGTLTNIRTIRKNIEKLLDLMERRESGDLEKYTKKERLLIDREIEKLLLSYGGITSLKRVPQAIVVVDAKREKTAVAEANRLGVPIISLLDTNTDPTNIDYPIPGNDDAIKSIILIINALSDALKEGYKEFEKSEEARRKEEEAQKKKEEEERKKAEAEKKAEKKAEEEKKSKDDKKVDNKKKDKPSEKSKKTKSSKKEEKK